MSGNQLWTLLLQGVYDTLYMTLPSTLFAYLLGLPLGVLLVICLLYTSDAADESLPV